MRPARLFLSLALLAGCASNPYRTNYTSLLPEKVPQGEPTTLLSASGEPQLLSSSDLRADSIKLLEKGYRPIGRSKFLADRVDGSAALAVARELGAEAVVVRLKHVGSKTITGTVSEWQPDRQIKQSETLVTSTGEPGKDTVTTRESITTIVGEYQVRYVPEQVETYEHTAVYWKRAPAPVLGLLVSELDEEARKAVQSNKGVEVKAVVKGSPAFLADLMRGDVVKALDGKEVIGPDDFFVAVMGKAGKAVGIDYWREGKMKKAKAELKAR